MDIEKALSRVDGDDGSIGGAIALKRIANGMIIIDWYSAGNWPLLLRLSVRNRYLPDDPENPQNWSSAKKLLVALELGYENYSVVWADRKLIVIDYIIHLYCVCWVFHLHASRGRCDESVPSRPYWSSSRIGNLCPCMSVTSEKNLTGFCLQFLDGIGPMLFSPLSE